MNRTLEIAVRKVYGVDRIYPMNVLAKEFARLLERQTLTVGDLRIIKGMGFEIVENSATSIVSKL